MKIIGEERQVLDPNTVVRSACPVCKTQYEITAGEAEWKYNCWISYPWQNFHHQELVESFEAVKRCPSCEKSNIIVDTAEAQVRFKIERRTTPDGDES